MSSSKIFRAPWNIQTKKQGTDVETACNAAQTLPNYGCVKLTWDVQEHYEEQEIVVAESEIHRVWHLQTPQLLAGYICLRCIQAQQLTCHSDRVQCDEQCVPVHVNKHYWSTVHIDIIYPYKGAIFNSIISSVYNPKPQPPCFSTFVWPSPFIA